MNEINIAENLTQLRLAKGVTQDEVANAVNVSNKTISKWENGTSSPDLPSLVLLAKYFNVSTDVLLGLKSHCSDTKQIIADLFRGVSRQEMANKIFELVQDTFPATYDAAGFGFDDICEEFDMIPPQTASMARFQVCLPEIFHFAVCSNDVNLAVMQLRNRANFAWLLDEKKQKHICELLAFLANPDVLNIMYYIHSAACSARFTAKFMADMSGVEPTKAIEILNKLCELDICSKKTVHMVDGEAELYHSYGDGLLFSLIAIVYERIFGKRSYEFNYNGPCKMIGGTK